MKRLKRLSRRDLVGVFVTAIALIGTVAFLIQRRPEAVTARYIAAHIKDPDRCDGPDFQPLWNPELAAWRKRAIRSSNFACGTAGPVVQWARFRTSADLEAALHASSGAPEYVCRTNVDLVRLIGFARAIDEATCAALHGRQVAF
jgi:hypothetical protein